MYKVDNAIIMAAGFSSRFAPLSVEKPKALWKVKGEILIERQIRQLQEAGIKEIIIVTGYKAEEFQYLEEKYGIKTVRNSEYSTRNNNSSIFAARQYIKNTYICSSDNYFPENPFNCEEVQSYYSAVYAEGHTDEWCLETDNEDMIKSVKIGGQNSWYMLGHVFWDETFSKKYLDILEKEYKKPETAAKYWEDLYIEHIDELPMKMKRFKKDYVMEFDSLDELREFDLDYRTDSGSETLRSIADMLDCKEGELHGFQPVKSGDEAVGVDFFYEKDTYRYLYGDRRLEKL